MAVPTQTAPEEDTAKRTDGGLTLRVAKATAVALAVVAVGFALWKVRAVIVLLLLALTLAAALRPGVEALRRRRVPEPIAILLFYALGALAVGLFVWLAVPPALHQIGHALLARPPGSSSGVRDRVLIWLHDHLRSLPTGTEFVHPIATYGHKATEAIVAIFFTLAATWYLISDRDSMIELLTSLAPESKRDRARATYLAIDNRLGAYTRLRFLMVFAVGAVLSAGFYVVGLDYWLLVGSFVGVAEIVPIIGPLVGALLVLAVGLPQSVRVAALALAWLYAVRLFQDYVVNPHVAVQTVGLSPLVTLLSVAVVGVLFGGLAVILAVPVTSTVATLIDVLVLGHQPPAENTRKRKGRRGRRAPRTDHDT
jgi:predicted PurR-regulated permease PerM